MNRNLLLAALLCATTGAALAEEANVCKSMCASEQRACRVQAHRTTELDREPIIADAGEAHPMARFAAQGQAASAPVRAAERDDFQRRVSERTGQCDTALQRCVRACGGPDASSGGSEILTKQGRDKRRGAAATSN